MRKRFMYWVAGHPHCVLIIEEITNGKLPLRFVNDSEWQNAAGYLKMIKNQGLTEDRQ
ncbi:hypothetical protein [Effusibacillus dendaii]|uniref:Uncharacterized protein n=1 Tax=Effusibacillus dendaii TaxID=2743772 RepID=A0A7I8DDG1_9BACL|nr:hypothetical protein [Effusibacillus dendaii]BCJ86560.1 hypothetical protein skT53_15450 [Effusibacillus dendaii]